VSRHVKTEPLLGSVLVCRVRLLERGPGAGLWEAGRALSGRGAGCAIVRHVELLRTPRLLLRRWEDSDVSAFFDIYSRDEVARWLGPQPRRALSSPEEASQRLSRWRAHDQGLDRPFGLWAIVPLAPAAGPAQQPPPADPAAEPAQQPRPADPVGTLLLLPLADASGPTALVEIGWHLHPGYHGRGLATEAARAVLAAAADAGIEQVLALTDLDNTASQAVATRLGMHDDGTTDRWFGLTLRQYRRATTAP
jgi:RimJ/RimL family protein N-acetyltransferase